MRPYLRYSRWFFADICSFAEEAFAGERAIVPVIVLQNSRHIFLSSGKTGWKWGNKNTFLEWRSAYLSCRVFKVRQNAFLCLCSSQKDARFPDIRPPAGRTGVGLHHRSCHHHSPPFPQTAQEGQSTWVPQTAGPAHGESNSSFYNSFLKIIFGFVCTVQVAKRCTTQPSLENKWDSV